MLQHLVISHSALFLLGEVQIPTLTHLTIHQYSYQSFPTHQPIMRSITYLFLNSSSDLLFIVHTTWAPEQFPCLTHVIWEICAFPEATLWFFLASFDTMNDLQVIGLRLRLKPQRGTKSHAHRGDLMSVVQACQCRHKNKVVVMPGGTFTTSYWRSWFQGGEDVWQTADRLLAQRESDTTAHTNRTLEAESWNMINYQLPSL